MASMHWLLWSALALASVSGCASSKPGQKASGGAAGQSGGFGGSAGRVSGGGSGGVDAAIESSVTDANVTDVTQRETGAPDAAPAIPHVCDAAAPAASDAQAGNACTACMRKECRCELAAGGDPEVVNCLLACDDVPPGLNVPPDLILRMIQWCRQGESPAIPPHIDDPFGTPARQYCGGPAAVTAPANVALSECVAEYCDCD